jgi:signal peptide peptidase SppA
MKRRAEPRRELTTLAQRVFNTPLMINEHKAEVIVAALHQRLGVGSFERLDSTVLGAADMVALAGDARRDYDNWKPFHVDDGIAVIPVVGTLVHRFGWLDPTSGMTGYDGIAKKFRAALTDPEVRAIWLDFDSPGGEVAGCFTLCEEIAAATQSEGGDKPVWAYVNEQATSAAYALASVCDRIYGPRTMIVGSIGCYIMHVDFSKAMDKNGLTVSIIRAGERKGRTGPYEPLDDPARAMLQGMVDETRDIFCRLVAMGRGIDLDAVMGTEAELYSGNDAVRLGLVDDVMSEAEAWGLLQLELGRAA